MVKEPGERRTSDPSDHNEPAREDREFRDLGDGEGGAIEVPPNRKEIGGDD
jgi:hypothetical protein